MSKMNKSWIHEVSLDIKPEDRPNPSILEMMLNSKYVVVVETKDETRYFDMDGKEITSTLKAE